MDAVDKTLAVANDCEVKYNVDEWLNAKDEEVENKHAVKLPELL